MQSSHKSGPDFLYDGLPQAAQDFFRNPTHSVQTIASKSRTKWSSIDSIWRRVGSLSKTKALLLLLWIWVLSWGEKNSFRNHVSRCKWEQWERWDSSADPHHMVLLADPQLIDPHTYPGRPWPLNGLTMKHTDQYLRRSFEALDNTLDPETIFFLGDLFDGGREWSTGNSKSPDSQWHKYGTEYWLEEYARFGNIYHEPWRRRTVSSSHPQRKMVSTIPGNHDFGLGHGIQIPVRDRFQTYFGFGNRIDSVGNHTFVSVDSVSLSAKLQFEGSEGYNPNPALWEPTEKFLSNVQQHKHEVSARYRHLQLDTPENALQNHSAVDLDPAISDNQWTVPEDSNIPEAPTIILSHVPFWREPDTPCGPQREKWPPAQAEYDPNAKDGRNAISVSYGYQYQNVLAKELSTTVVKSVGNVKHIFSGDDHDYCELIHNDLDPNQPSIREITVKSTSWAMGVRKPGFLLVSLWNPLDGAIAPEQTIQTHLCLLPDQLGIFIRYLQLIILTLLVLGVRTFVVRRNILKSPMREDSLLPTPVTTPTYPTAQFKRNRSDSGSYSSSSSNGKTGLAARSNAGRNQALSPIQGYGFGDGLSLPSPSNNGYLSPARAYSPAHTNPNDERWKPSSVSTSKRPVGLLSRPTQDFLSSFSQVAVGALLWYWWLIKTV